MLRNFLGDSNSQANIWCARLALLVSVAAIMSCDNILSEFGDPDTNEAKLVEAKLELNDSNWDEAIELFEDMDSDFLEQREVALLYASAYSGRCGVDILDFATGLGSLGLNTLFGHFMDEMTSGTAEDAADCKVAETIIRTIAADASNRTDDENLMLTMISLAKIGIHLSLYADEDDNDTVDGTFDACVTTAVGIPDADAAEVATGFTNALASLEALVASGSMNVDGLDVNDFDSLCTAIAAIDPTWDFCDDYDVADITGNKQKAIRSVIKESVALGIGANCVGDITTCNCP